LIGAGDAPVPVLGYSMGGRLALSLALDRPDLVERVIVVSASAGIADPDERDARRVADADLADWIVAVGIDRFLDEWRDRPLTSTAGISDAERRRDRAVREESSAVGLAAALRILGQGAYPYLGDRLGGLSMPFLAVSGGKDQRYTEHASLTAATVPDGRHITIPDVGHNVVLEAPDRLAEIVRAFLAE
jgi:2-succinyl-6-hydroxy-2,4-cyclohexadiene-1-carboxylate synthase